jgi:hypothetical protein
MNDSDKVLDKINEMLAERYKVFMDNVFPKTHKIMETITDSPLVYDKAWREHSDYGIKINGVKILFDTNYYYTGEDGRDLINYALTIRYNWRKVLRYRWDKGAEPTLDRFHECEWIYKLDGIPEMVQKLEETMTKHKFEKDFKKHCKDFIL